MLVSYSPGTGAGGYSSRMALVPASTSTVLDWTPESVRAAIYAADAGMLRDAADLCDVMLRDDRIAADLDKIALGLPGLPFYVEGDEAAAPEIEALWPRIANESELAAITRWGLLLGGVWARKRWRWTEDATAPLGGRALPYLEFWHPRDLRIQREANGTIRYFLTTYGGEIEVRAGKDWVFWTPFGENEFYRRGLWNRLATPWLAKLWAIEDRARASEVTPILAMKTKGLSEPQRQAVLADMTTIGRNTRLVLPEGCELDAVGTGSETTASVQAESITWADGAISIAIVGQKVTSEGTSGFSNGNVNANVERSILRFVESTLSTCLSLQYLRPFLALTYGSSPEVFVRWETRSPEEIAAEAKSANEIAEAIPGMNKALASSGKEVDAAALLRSMRIPTRALPATPGTAAVSRATLSGGRDRLAFARHSRPAMTVALQDEPPTEFRIFAWGANETDKGTFYLTQASARNLMWAIGTRDVMIDLEHLSLDPEGPHYANGGADARGWARLKLDERGLYACDVRWTEDGAARIREKRQRYISPAFDYDNRGRITALVNIALTALPATVRIDALVAANVTGGIAMDLVDTIKAMLKLAPEASDEEVLAAFSARLAGESLPAEPPGDAPPPTDDLSAAPEGAAAPPAETDEEKARRLSASAGASAVATLARSVASQGKVLAALTAQARKDKVASLILLNRTRIPEALTGWAQKQTPEALEAWLRDAPEVYPDGGTASTGSASRGGEGGTATLSKRDAAFTELCNGDPARIAKIRARDAARKAEAARRSDPLDG